MIRIVNDTQKGISSLHWKLGCIKSMMRNLSTVAMRPFVYLVAFEQKYNHKSPSEIDQSLEDFRLKFYPELFHYFHPGIIEEYMEYYLIKSYSICDDDVMQNRLRVYHLMRRCIEIYRDSIKPYRDSIKSCYPSNYSGYQLERLDIIYLNYSGYQLDIIDVISLM